MELQGFFKKILHLGSFRKSPSIYEVNYREINVRLPVFQNVPLMLLEVNKYLNLGVDKNNLLQYLDESTNWLIWECTSFANQPEDLQRKLLAKSCKAKSRRKAIKSEDRITCRYHSDFLMEKGIYIFWCIYCFPDRGWKYVVLQWDPRAKWTISITRHLRSRRESLFAFFIHSRQHCGPVSVPCKVTGFSHHAASLEYCFILEVKNGSAKSYTANNNVQPFS